MKKPFIFAALALLVAAGARAQTPAPDRAALQQATSQTQRLAQEIGLTAAQLPQVRQIFLVTRQEMDAARAQASASGDSKSLRPAMQAARAKADTQLRTVLTAAQFAKYQQVMAARISQLHTTVQTN